MGKKEITENAKVWAGKMVKEMQKMPLADKVHFLNEVRAILHQESPFNTEPVDFVRWVPCETVEANDYNPNSVAPPEMELLRTSILEDGYTQPIVGWERNDVIEVVDGFHRNRVGKEFSDVHKRVNGYLPVSVINADRQDRNDRIASTIRHNRARGKHKVESMSDIVVELKRRNWSDEKICRELGMDQDEVLRLCQITGLSEIFSDQEFSRAWDVEGHVTPDDFEELTDDVDSYGDEASEFRKVPANREGRILHTWDKWECYRAGFYETTSKEYTKEQALQRYRDFLADPDRFEPALKSIISEWKHSCEHYLTNPSMNRIAWLGQASACYALGIPSTYRGGFTLLTEDEQRVANELALKYLNQWLRENGREEVDMDAAWGGQSDLY